MNHPRNLILGPMLALAFLVAACSSGGSATPQPSPTPATQVTPTEQAPSPTATSVVDAGGVPARPGPEPGVACPIAIVICQFAVDMETIVLSGNADAFFEVAPPVPATCSGEATTPGVTAAVCEGAAAGEVRASYWAIQGGEALRVSETELRTGLARWFDSATRAGGASDTYGPGEVRIASISCTRRPEAKSGDCIGNSIQVHFTFINPADSKSTGTPGLRTTFHISAAVVDGVVRANGFGIVSPLNRVLSPSVINIQDSQGSPLVVEVYPWTH